MLIKTSHVNNDSFWQRKWTVILVPPPSSVPRPTPVEQAKAKFLPFVGLPAKDSLLRVVVSISETVTVQKVRLSA